MIWLITTIVVFYFARQLSKQLHHPILNPLLISITVLIPLLLWLEIPYQIYFEQNKWLNYLLQPAVVALAYPLYEQLPQIKKKWKVITSICFISSLLSMFIGGSIALFMGADPVLVATLLPKSVTTPIAMAVAEQLDGIPAVAAVFVMIAGIFGAVLGYPLFKLLGIKTAVAKGLTIGAVSHALGTAKATDESYQDGAFSSLALVLCGVFTSILAPFVFPLLLTVFGL